MYDILMLGHISKDVIQDPSGRQDQLGGPVIYASAAACRSGASVLVVTKASASDRDKLEIIHENGADLHFMESTESTSIHNLYENEDHERRIVTLLSAAEPFRLDEIPGTPAHIYHLAGLFAGEIPVDLIDSLSARGLVALDAQGVVRKRENGRLVSSDWESKHRYLPSVTHLKTDAAEAEMLTGCSDREEAAERLRTLGAAEVMVTHHSEVLLASEEGVHRASLTPRNLTGRTGRGDTCFAAYLAWRLRHNREESLRYAAALVSIKLETPGVFRGTQQDVLRRID